LGGGKSSRDAGEIPPLRPKHYKNERVNARGVRGGPGIEVSLVGARKSSTKGTGNRGLGE